MRFRSMLPILALFCLSCASRTFHIASEPITAKVYYQTFKTAKFKGYSPVSFSVEKDDIGPSSKIVVETDGYKRKEVNVGGFDGTDIYLMVKLEAELDPRFAPPPAAGLEGKLETSPITAQEPLLPPEPSPVVPPVAKVPAPERTSTPTSKPGTLEAPAPPAENKSGGDATSPVTAEAAPGPSPGVEVVADDPSGDAPPLQGLEAENERLRQELDQLKHETREEGEGVDIRSINRAMQHILRAQRLIQMDRLDEALVETFKALSISEKLASAYAMQGSIYYLKKDYPSCMAAWQQAFELDPSNLEVYDMLKFMKSKFGM